MDEGLEMTDVQCIDCDSSFTLFSFATKSFTISKVKLDQINTQQALSSSPLIFKL